MFRLISLLLYILTVLHSETTASVTLLITGRSSDNVYKHQLAKLFVDSYDELIAGSHAQIFAFTNGVSVPAATDSIDLLETWTDLDMHSNVTTLVVTNLGTDEMSLDHLSILQRFMKTKKAFVAIEIGSPAIQTRALLERSAACPLEGRARILSPNSAYFCNKAKPRMIADLRFDQVHEVPPNFKPVREQPEKISLVPDLFASAAKTGDRKHQNLSAHQHHDHYHHHHTGHTHHHHRKHHLEEDVDQIVSQIMEEIAQESTAENKEPEFSKLPEGKKRMICKYRKSCYETGVRPKIDDDWIFYPSHWWPAKKEIEIINRDENESEPYNVEEDLMLQKFHCKYRVSCYEERGIPFTEKPERKEARSVLASKKKVQPGKKKTLKEIAAQTLQKVEMAKEKAAKRPAIKVVEKKLTANQEKINEKLNCKYRKSCYETGQKPVFDEGWILPLPVSIFSTESAESISKELNYSELEELEKKVYCKYRKSCYETGVKPEIEPEFFIQTIIDLATIHEQVETRKLSLQEKCKYRKSCYETGIVPEINPKLEAVIQKEVSSIIPSNVQDLKLLCKYRKSCYAEIHDSATVDTIKSIRKRRQIEKEVRRRKAKRAKLHHRLRGEMQLGHWRKYSRKTAYQESPEPAPEVIIELKRAKSHRSRQASKAKEPEPEVEEVKAEKIGLQEDKQEEPESEPEQEPEPQPKKQRKMKRMKLEEQADERKVKKFTTKPKTIKTEDEFFREEQLKPGKPTRPKQEAKKKEAAKPKKVIEEEEQKDEEEKKEEKEEQEEAAVQLSKEIEEQAEIEKEKGRKQEKQKEQEKATLVPDTAKDAMQKLIDDMHHQQELQQQKEYCKYRKSCYESGEKPKIDTTVVGVITSFGEQLEKAYEEEEEAIAKARAEINKKLKCKYRKSCYETGILPEIKKRVEEEKHGIVFKTGISKQLQCKYRKSCYEEMGITVAKKEVSETEEVRKSGQNATRRDGDATSLRAGKDGAERRTLKEIHASIAQQKQEILMKEKCRAGKACYASVESKTIHEDHAGNTARVGAQRFLEHGKCSPYYYSCRQVLGLPMPEKAPIGPNGKRLCRKKKL